MDEEFRKQRENIFFDIERERFSQDQKWGSQKENHNYFWVAILAEESGEVAEASQNLEQAKPQMLKEYYRKQLRQELVQVAAVAVAWIEALDSKK